VVIGLGALFVSGIALAASGVEAFAVSPAFLVKLGLVVLLSGNGLFLSRVEALLRRDPTRWQQAVITP